jgi:hypothetical protein
MALGGVEEDLEQARSRRRWYGCEPPLTREWLPGALAPKKLEGVSLVPLSAVLKVSSP